MMVDKELILNQAGNSFHIKIPLPPSYDDCLFLIDSTFTVENLISKIKKEEERVKNVEIRKDNTRVALYVEILKLGAFSLIIEQKHYDVTINREAQYEQEDSPSSEPYDSNTIGSPCFDVIRRGRVFIDKTTLIKKILTQDEKVILITAPPRMGKSVNIDMFKQFLQIQDREKRRAGLIGTPFANTLIADDLDFVKRHYAAYPVIHLNLSGTPNTFTSTFVTLWNAMRDAYLKCSFLENSGKCSKKDKQLYASWVSKEPPEWSDKSQQKLENSLFELSFLLKKHFDKEVVILVDEFDALVTNAMFFVSSDDLRKIIQLRDSILGKAVKNFTGYSTYKVAVLTGVANVICNTASPLRSVSRFPFLQNKNFFQYYGVLQAELEKIVPEEEKRAELEKWYNGYCYKNLRLYNTWSLVKAISNDCIENYWIEETQIITKFRNLACRGEFSTMLNKLLIGEELAVEKYNFKNILNDENLVSMARCLQNGKAIHSGLLLQFLFENGYLSKTENTSNKKLDFLRIPNEEIRFCIRNLCSVFFESTCNIKWALLNDASDNFPRILECQNEDFEIQTFREKFEKVCGSYSSNFPFNHQIIHSLLFYIMLDAQISWSILGLECGIKQKSGSNRCDVVAYLDGILFITEIKYKASVEAALKQIKQKEYKEIATNRSVMKNFKVKDIKYYVYMGLAVYAKKRVSIKIEILDKKKNLIKTVV